jgi:NAD(P)-dependent dehydrogenase (short-subunit alcohol dehydrogenase family)
MDRLKDKVAIITGAAGGMGAAEARLFAKEGAHVLATDMQYEKLNAWVAQAKKEGLKIECVQHDVTSETDWKTVTSKTSEIFGKIDILVNNAGVFPAGGTTANTNLADWQKIMAINLTGPFLGVQAVLPYMQKNKGGAIVNVSSIAGMVGGNGPAYTASKGGLRLLTKDMAIEFARDKIRVNSLHPGGVKTPMTEFFMTMPNAEELAKGSCPQGRLAEAIELAYAALFLASDESSFMTGAELVVDGGAIAR